MYRLQWIATYPKHRSHSIGPDILIIFIFLSVGEREGRKGGEHGGPCRRERLRVCQVCGVGIIRLGREEGRERTGEMMAK